MNRSMPGIMRISKGEWQRLGGLRNSRCFRKGTKRGGWTYWLTMDSLR